MTAYYNEWDSYAAQWLRKLIAAGHLPLGDVDERSITDVEPEELTGYTQHHFFAGIGGWAYAARLAGFGDDQRIVTGSPPCQPFSLAGQHRGYTDERHLAPHWLRMVKTLRAPFVFAEQVASAIGKDCWLDDLLDELENQGYATGSVVSPACSVGAPHIRQRLWVAARLGDAEYQRSQRNRRSGEKPVSKGWSGAERHGAETSLADMWRNPDWLQSQDGKQRPVRPGTFPLAHGISSRVGRLRAYGNAIVPQVAAKIIKAVLDNDQQTGNI